MMMYIRLDMHILLHSGYGRGLSGDHAPLLHGH